MAPTGGDGVPPNMDPPGSENQNLVTTSITKDAVHSGPEEAKDLEGRAEIWKEKLLSGLSSKGKAKLSYFPPTVKEGKIIVECPTEIVEEGELMWKGWLVGCMIDKKLPFSYVKNMAYTMWNPKGLLDVQFDGTRFYFHFLSAEDKEKVLEGGPWFFGGGLMVIKEWTPELEASKFDLTTVPIWAKLFDVPKQYWTQEGLSYIGSGIGKPLHLDRATEERTRLSYARICVEVNLMDALPESLQLDLGKGKQVEILVEYPWVPIRCSLCSIFGHEAKNSDCGT